MNIEITDQTNTLNDAHIKLLTNILQFSIETENIENKIEVSLTIVNDEQIRNLNHTYRGIDAPTDVLSFEMEDPFQALTNHEVIQVIPIGDIIISIDKVFEQSDEYQHSFERELAFLTVHGFLHLIGYTHDHEEEEKKMFERQECILKEFQLER